MQRALEALKKGEPDSSRRYQYWATIASAIDYPGDDPESANMDWVCNNDIMNAVAAECEANDGNTNAMEQALVSATMFCLSAKNVDKVSPNTRLIRAMVKIAKERLPSHNGSLALTALKSLALFPVSHKNLLDAGVLQLALSSLQYLDADQPLHVVVGINAASCICRLVGKEESGPGPDAIKANSKLVDKLLWLLSQTLNVRPNETVLEFCWNVGNIVSDVATLATSDRNKPLLVSFIPELVRSLELRMENRRAIHFSIVALSQLTFEPRCKPAFDAVNAKLNQCLSNVLVAYNDDVEIKRNAQVLQATINESAKPQLGDINKKSPASGMSFRRVAKAVLTSKKAGEKPDQQTPGHVMISYQWDSQPIAVEIERRLRNGGVKTWFDLNDMGGNINDSMAYAVENAIAIVVLFCRKYKESSNCRKECEMADSLQKNMIFVRVEKDYKQEAWLSLVMGKSLWIDCPAVQSVDSAFAQVAKRISQVTSQPIKASSPTTPVAAPAPATTSASTSSEGSEAVVGMLKTIMSQIGEMRAEIGTLKTGIQELKEGELSTDIKELKDTIEQLRNDVNTLKG